MPLQPPVSSSTSSSGSGNAVSESIGQYGHPDFDFFYNVSADGDIVIEVSEDGGTTWREMDRIDTTGNRSDVVQASTMFGDVRVYADSGDFNDADVSNIILSVRGNA